MREGIVIVGASVATTAFLERARECGYTGTVTVIDSDLDAPYDRPPLSKAYLDDGDVEAIAVDWNDFNVRFIRAEATGVDLVERVVETRDPEGHPASGVPFTDLIIASGAQPARLPFEPEGTVVLRSAADARNLRTRVGAGDIVTIIGAGAIGVELASSLSRNGVAVTVLDRAVGPLERLLGGHLSEKITSWLVEAGVTPRWDVGIESVQESQDGWKVILDDGEAIDSDIVISAVGSKPTVGWLTESGLLRDGMLIVDEVGAVETDGRPQSGVYAIGDVATRFDESGLPTRTESWSAAREQGVSLANHLFDSVAEPVGASYFWTEVAGRKIQVVGHVSPAGIVELESEKPERGRALYRVSENGRDDSWIGVNAQPQIARLLMASMAEPQPNTIP